MKLAEQFAEQRAEAFFAPAAFCALLLRPPFTYSKYCKRLPSSVPSTTPRFNALRFDNCDYSLIVILSTRVPKKQANNALRFPTATLQPLKMKLYSGTRLPLESFVLFLTFVTVLRIAFFTTYVVFCAERL